MNETLTIGEDLNKEFYVKGATDEIVTCVDDALFILKRGETNRHYAATMMNHSSSRSHTIFRIVNKKIIYNFTQILCSFFNAYPQNSRNPRISSQNPS